MFKLLTQQVRHFSRSALRQVRPTAPLGSSEQTAAEKIDVSKAIEGWDEKLRESGVGDIEFNLKCLVAKVLQKKFVSV